MEIESLGDSGPPGLQWKKTSPSPPEELTSHGEATYTEVDIQEEIRAKREDSSHRPDVPISSTKHSSEDFTHLEPPKDFCVQGPMTSPPSQNSDGSTTQLQQALWIFRKIASTFHNVCDPWNEFQFSPGDYEKFDHELRQDEYVWGYTQGKIRYDYNALTHLLAVRRPIYEWEVFTGFVARAISGQLDQIGKGSDNAAAFAREIGNEGAATIVLEGETDSTGYHSKRDPNLSFRHGRTRYPGVVIEFIDPEKQSTYRQAKSFIIGSQMHIQAFVCIDLPYGRYKAREARLSVWRPKLRKTINGRRTVVVVRDVKDDIFRDHLGNPTDHPGLQLRLSDFSTPRHTSDLTRDQDRDINLSTHELCECLSHIENSLPEHAHIREDVPSSFRRRRRSPSPPRILAPRKAAKCVEVEQKE